MPDEWFAKLGRDEIEPLLISNGSFTLTNTEQFRLICQSAYQREFIVGTERDLEGITEGQAFLAFWARNVGLAVVSESMEVVSHRGDMAFEDIKAKSIAWWEYWRRYWDQIHSDNSLPYDPLCEVTIPLKKE